MLTSKGGGQIIGDALSGLISRLQKISDTPGLDAQVLLAHQLDRPRSWVLAHPEVQLTKAQVNRLEEAVTNLEGGQPLPYILGTWEFFGLEFEVTPAVLIPRPETELLVEQAISWLQNWKPGNVKLRVLDVGTGSGCIAIALAVHVPTLGITATDISPAALDVARKNAYRMDVSDRITFIETDLFPPLSILDPFPLILSNLPYIPTETMKKNAVYGQEPAIALDGGPDGMEVISRFLEKAPSWLLSGGAIFIEIEASEGPMAKRKAADTFPNAGIRLHKDLAGHDRLLEVQT
jgi:release factor glutamine methyltransferase